MKRKRFTEEQIIGILKEAEAGAKNQELCRKRLRELETENRRLKQLLAEAHLDNAALKDVLSKNW